MKKFFSFTGTILFLASAFLSAGPQISKPVLASHCVADLAARPDPIYTGSTFYINATTSHMDIKSRRFDLYMINQTKERQGAKDIYIDKNGQPSTVDNPVASQNVSVFDASGTQAVNPNILFGPLNTDGSWNLNSNHVYRFVLFRVLVGAVNEKTDSQRCDRSDFVPTIKEGKSPTENRPVSGSLCNPIPGGKLLNPSEGTALIKFKEGGLSNRTGEYFLFDKDRVTKIKRTPLQTRGDGSWEISFSGLKAGESYTYGVDLPPDPGWWEPSRYNCSNDFALINASDAGSGSQGGGFGGYNTCKDGSKGVETGLGCLPSDPGKLAGALFSIALGIAGAIAVIMIIIGGFKVATSQGNVDALQDGKDTITKAITGLAFILLATTILGIIGIDILGIKFFSRDGAGIIINQK